MMKKILAFCVYLTLAFAGKTQSNLPRSLSPQAKAYLITCGPGHEIWSHFGHTAIKFKDPNNRLDIAFNYGMFDTSDPDFVWKFAKRSMQYFLHVSSTDQFLAAYIHTDRFVYEQEILVPTEKINALYETMLDNYCLLYTSPSPRDS